MSSDAATAATSASTFCLHGHDLKSRNIPLGLRILSTRRTL